MKLVLAAATAVASFLLAPATPAQACSPPPPLQADRRLTPADGALGVPTNTRVLIRFSGRSTFQGYEVHIRPVGGEEATTAVSIASDGSRTEAIALVAPSSALAPNTTYELLDNGVSPCEADACFGSGFAVIGHFTTGAGPDTTPPVFAPHIEQYLGWRDVCDSSACCGPYDAQHFSFEWDAASDDNVVFYEISEASRGVIQTGLGTSVGGVLFCDGVTGNPPNVSLFGSGTFVIRAVDIAGNATAAAPFASNGECPDDHPHFCDGGFSDSGDGGIASTPTPLASDAGGGCRIGGRMPLGGAAPLFGLALLALTITRRRR